MKLFTKFLTCATAATMFLSGCKKDEGINIFSIQDDKDLGLMVSQQIAGDPGTYPVLDRATYASAYTYLNNMRDLILASGQVTYKTEFPWELHIIRDDATLNAFCTPGGYIYVYTGLIKYLDNASSLAGVLGHEMAHADKRHSTEAATKQYGITTLLSVVLGKDPGLLVQVSESLVNLKFSRDNESEADKYSVIYLCPTKYKSDGAASFFLKLDSMGSSNPPEFLSTHPSPDNRVSAIQAEASGMTCSGGNITTGEENDGYAAFKASLP